MLENDEQNHREMLSESVPMLIVFRVSFYQKTGVRGEFIRMSCFLRSLVFCLQCLILDPLALAQSKRSSSFFELPFNMCNFGVLF